MMFTRNCGVVSQHEDPCMVTVKQLEILIWAAFLFLDFYSIFIFTILYLTSPLLVID